MNPIQLTQGNIELLEGFLMNHFRPFSCYFDGVSDVIKEFETDPDYGKSIKTIFETVLCSHYQDNKNQQSADTCYVRELAEGELTQILRQSANWYICSDEEALRKLASIYEDTLEEIQVAQVTKLTDISTEMPLKNMSVFSHLYPIPFDPLASMRAITEQAANNPQTTEQKTWSVKDILGCNIKSVADELESYYMQNLSITKDAFFRQIGVSFGVAVLSSVLAGAPKKSSEKQQQLRQAIGKFCKRLKRHEIHTVLETALQIMYELDDADKTIASDDITLVLHFACQLLSDEDLHQFALYDWFDLIFDGEALSNDVIRFAPLIYQWIVLDVLPSASQKKLPSHILLFDELIPSKTYLNALSGE